MTVNNFFKHLFISFSLILFVASSAGASVAEFTNKAVISNAEELLKMPDHKVRVAKGAPTYQYHVDLRNSVSELKAAAKRIKDEYVQIKVGPVCSVKVKEDTEIIEAQAKKIHELKALIRAEQDTPTFHTGIGEAIGVYAPNLVQGIGQACGFQYKGIKAVPSGS